MFTWAIRRANAFRNDEDGAITVDWVLLVAAVVGLGVAVLVTVGPSMVVVADKASDCQELAAQAAAQEGVSYLDRLSDMNDACQS